MTIKFNDLPWHDADLQAVYIDRRKPGDQDVIKLQIVWPDNNYSSTIEFHDCYAFKANMNFGIVACESILAAECLYDSEELNFIRKQWEKSTANLKDLKCFKITTNSTNSVINIFALDYQITNQE
jgi:hypothetical protein